MEKEIDLSIARFIKEQLEREEEEKRERLRKQYDPRERITYTLEELIEGIRKGKQYIYTLRMEFEPRQLFERQVTIPYIKNFFDVEDSQPESVLFASNQRETTMTLAWMPCKKVKQSLDQWIAETREAVKEFHWNMKPERKKSMGNMEYFCFAMPTAEGKLYSVMFRFQQGERLYVGALNCPEKERKGMGLLLEAMVYVIEEMNC